LNKKIKQVAMLFRVLLILSLMLPITVTQLGAAMLELPTWSYGKVVDTKSSSLGQGATYTWYDLNVDQSTQKVHTVEFDPRNPNLKLVAGTKSGYVSGMSTLTKMAEYVDAEHHRVIAGINADFYEISGHATGVPNGIFIHDGIILTNDRSPYAFGLKADGTSIYGNPQLQETITIHDEQIALTSINRFRDPNQLVLFTSNYGASTGAARNGVEVVLTIESGELKHGQNLELVVEEVQTDVGNAVLSPGKVVLSASGDKASILAGLTEGDRVTANVELHPDWADVVVAVGGNGPLVKDGVAYTNVSPAGIHPRTALGTKADGSIVFFEVDGRQPGFSDGLETGQVAQLLVEMGVVNALNLDGGGSSTLIARLPGSEKTVMMNSGSDGIERSIGNGLLLVNTGVETGIAEKITITPGSARLLVGSSIQLTAAGLDVNDHPAALNESTFWSVDETYGSINEHGVFTAGEAAGFVEIDAVNGAAAGHATIEVVDTLTELKLPDAERTYTSEAAVQVTVTALRDGQVIQADPSAFTWEVIGEIGTIDSNGLFKATDKSGATGEIRVSFGDVSTSYKVNVGLPPVILEDFETNLDRYLPSSGAAYNSMSIELETNQDFVRSGNSSLKLTYDFIGTQGTSGAYLNVKSVADRLEIPGYPEKIGMWVYGDAEGHWLRAQLRDGANAAVPINFTESNPGVDWEGWRYVEAAVPAGRPTPLSIDMPVRYMETSNANKTAGTLYIDDIRAIYGPLNEDVDAPIIASIYPEENAIVTTGTPEFKIVAHDDGYEPELHPASTLINPDTIRFYLDGEQLSNYGFYPPRGEISYTPTNPLSEGRHTVKVAVRDMSGNQVIKEWAFNVNFGSPYFTYHFEEQQRLGAVHGIELGLEHAEKAASGTFSFAYPVLANGTAVLENFEFIPSEGISADQVILSNDASSGVVSVTFSDLSGFQGTASIGRLQYNVNSSIMGPYTLTTLMSNPSINGALEVIEAAVATTEGAINDYYGASYDVKINPDYKLTWNHYETFKGEPATLLVTERETGLPVEGAQIVYNGEALSGVTNANGEIVTDILTAEAGTYSIQANKDKQYSALMSFVVAEYTGTEAPYNMNVTMGDDAMTTRNMTWHTNPSVTDTIVELAIASEFEGFHASNVQRVVGTNAMYTTDKDGTFRVHRVELKELEPGTTYNYRVGDGASQVSSMGSFTTAAEGQAEVNIAFFGDSQAESEANFALWGETVDAAMAEGINYDLLIHAGDMVDHGNNLNQWNWWFNAAQSELMNSTLVPIIGNHEVIGNNGLGDYLSFFNLPKSGLELSSGVNYSFDYGDVHIVVLNTESGSAGIREQSAWLEQDLQQTDKKWKVAIFHQGPYGSTYANTEVQQQWVPLFDKYGVDLVLTGHDHIYLRSKQLAAGEPVDEQKHATTYVIGGSSGPKFYGLDDLKTSSWREVVFADNTQIYTTLRITEEEIAVIVKTTAGAEVDSFELTKVPASSLDLTKNSGVIKENDTVQLQAVLEPVETTAFVAWSIISEHTEPLATLTAAGELTALKPGVITIQAAVSGQPELTKTMTITIQSSSGGSEPPPVPNVPQPEPADDEYKVEQGTLFIEQASSDQVTVKTDKAIHAIQLSSEVLKQVKKLVVETSSVVFTLDERALQSLANELANDSASIKLQLTSPTSDQWKADVERYYAQASEQARLHSEVYELTGGNVQLEAELHVTLPQDAAAHTAGLYEVLPDGSMIYAGGVVDSGKLIATMASGKIYVVASLEKDYEDVSDSHWAKAFIEELTAKQIVNGVSATAFKPNQEVTRAEFTAMLVRTLRLEASSTATFADVAASSWYYEAVGAAVQAGLVNGKTTDRFDPNASITREEMAVMLMRAYEQTSGKTTTAIQTPFEDMDQVSQWAQHSVAAAYEAGFISGKTVVSFNPSGNGTRAESAKILLLLYQAVIE